MAGPDEFEGRSLDALYAMVASAKPADLTGAGEALAGIGSEIDGIAGELREYVARVAWKGEAGDAFREWGQDMVRETLRLAEYSTVMGTEMERAGQALTEARAAVPAPAGQCFADPEKEKARIADEELKREEAINQLNRLSSYYTAVSDRMAAEPEPNFRPMDGGWRPIDQGRPTAAQDGGATAGTQGREGTGPFSPFGAAHSSAANGTAPGAATEGQAQGRDAGVGTVIDSTEGTTRPESGLRREGPAGPSLPTPHSGPTVHPVAPVTVISPPQAAEKAARTGPSNGPGGGRPSTPPTGASRGRAPDGVVGGVPQRSSPPPSTSRLPRGVVAGEEQRLMGRGSAGAGAPTGATGSRAGGPGGAQARRVAVQPGGAVGNTRPGARGRADFTPGGAGLVRNTPVSGASSSRAPRAAADAEPSEERPDYLLEDEETWTSGRHRPMPPVID
ncbi:hypothetical protein [Streptomyces albus]|uniref:hypothetical protein n=1 Tax=Streptomyces albus TaxID=1888 RepID=UPI0004C755DD|nr:hypothetical protein [Streptomyces albus]